MLTIAVHLLFTFAHASTPTDTDPVAALEQATDAPALDAAYIESLVDWMTEGPDGMPVEEAREQAEAMATFEASMPWQQGRVPVDDIATLELRSGARFVGTEGAASVLEAWGNPPGQQPAGMILPAGTHLFGPDSWAVIVDYEDVGWVDDSDASSIDYDELLVDMKASNAEGNEARRELGLEGLTLLDWAEVPRYDPATKVLYWARSLRPDSGGETLNYEVRVLGRGGVLSLNAVGSLEQLGLIRGAMEPIRQSAAFVAGQTHADYEPGVDPSAGFGVAALVAGGAVAASKTGLLKGLFAALLAGKKFIVIGLVALGSLGAKLLGRKPAAPDA